MKKFPYFFGLILMVISLLSSCTSAGKEIFSIVPESTLGMLTFNPDVLIEKGQIQEMNFTKENHIHQEFIRDLLLHPDKSGLNLNAYSGFFVFSNEEKFGCLLMPLKRRSSFEEFIEEYEEKNNLDLLREENEEYTFIEHKNSLIGYDNERFFVLSGMGHQEREELKSVAMDIINTEKEASLLADKNFSKFFDNQKDVNLWLSSTNLDDFPGMNQMEAAMQIFNVFKNNYVHMHLEFQEGAMVMQSNVAFNLEMKETINEFNFLDQNASRENLRYLPAKDLIMAGNAGMNPEKLLNLLKLTKTDIGRVLREIENELKLEDGEIEELLEGDFALSVNGVKDIEKENGYKEDFHYLKKSPVVTVVIQLKNEDLYGEIISYLREKFPISEKDGYYILNEESDGVYFTLNENFLILSNISENIISISTKGELQDNLLQTDISDQLVKDPLCLYINLNRSSYSEEMNEYLDKDLQGSVKKGMENFGSKLQSLTISGGLEKTEFRLEFTDHEKNSLQILLAGIDSLSTIAAHGS